MTFYIKILTNVENYIFIIAKKIDAEKNKKHIAKKIINFNMFMLKKTFIFLICIKDQELFLKHLKNYLLL